MASLVKAKEKWNPATAAGRSVRKATVCDVSLKRFVSSLANAGHGPEAITKVILVVYGVRVVKTGDSSADTVKQSSFRMWMRWGAKGTKDNGESRPESYYALPDKLVAMANDALNGKPVVKPTK